MVKGIILTVCGLLTILLAAPLRANTHEALIEGDKKEGSLVLLHSDGLASRWQLDRYAGLALKHPSLIAGVLYRDSARGRDDVTVLVVRERSECDR